MIGSTLIRQDYVSDVLPVVERWARKCGLDDDGVCDAGSLAWYYWSLSDKTYAPTHWARIAVRHVRAGRSLPGTNVSEHDVTARGVNYGGGAISGLADRTPGPVQCAEEREGLENLLGVLTAREAHLAALTLAGWRVSEIAKLLNCSPAWVTKQRQRLAAKIVQ